MSKWDETPHSVASKLELGTKDQRHVPLCPNSMEEEENLHSCCPVLGDFRLTHFVLIILWTLRLRSYASHSKSHD